MERSDGSGAIFAGGAVVVIVLMGAFLKLIKLFFLELGKTFDALAIMAKALIGLLFSFAIDASLFGCAVAAIYFTYRYILMVKQATQIKEELETRLDEFRGEMRSECATFQAEVNGDVRRIAGRLHDALKKPEVAPEIPKAQVTMLPPPAESTSANSVEPEPGATLVTNESPKETDAVDMSSVANPF